MTQSPHLLSEIRMRKSAEFSRLSEEYSNILDVKAKWWNEYGLTISEEKSHTLAERMWKITPAGTEEQKLKLKMTALTTEMNAISSHLRVKESEARQIF